MREHAPCTGFRVSRELCVARRGMTKKVARSKRQRVLLAPRRKEQLAKAAVDELVGLSKTVSGNGTPLHKSWWKLASDEAVRAALEKRFGTKTSARSVRRMLAPFRAIVRETRQSRNKHRQKIEGPDTWQGLHYCVSLYGVARFY